MQEPKHTHHYNPRQNLLPPEAPHHHETLDVREFGRILLRQRRLIGMITTLVVLMTLLYALFSSSVYQATAKLQIDREPSKIGTVELPNSDSRDTRDFNQTQIELIQSRQVASQVVNDLRLLDTLPSASLTERLKLWLGFMQPEDRRAGIETALLANLSVKFINNSRLAEVSYTAKDAKMAAEFANAFADAFVSLNESNLRSKLKTAVLIQQDTQPAQPLVDANKLPIPNNVRVIDHAAEPQQTQKPKLSTLLAAGMLLGLLLGIAAAFLRDFLDNTARDVNALERQTQLPVLSVIPETPAPAPSVLAIMVLRKTRSAIAEAFRTLRTALRFELPSTDSQVLLITSSTANEGKTTITCNLACTYAHAGHRVLIIDCDLRNPTTHKLLNVRNGSGLSDYLTDRADLDDVVTKTHIGNLFLIPAGFQPHDPAEILSSPEMHDLLALLREQFDYILIDTPPVMGLADTLVLMPLASTTLLTVRAEHTRMDTLQQVLKRLRHTKAPIGGIIFNRADLTKSNSYGYEYAAYQYGAEVAQTQTPSTAHPAIHLWLSRLKQWLNRLTKTS